MFVDLSLLKYFKLGKHHLIESYDSMRLQRETKKEVTLCHEASCIGIKTGSIK